MLSLEDKELGRVSDVYYVCLVLNSFISDSTQLAAL